MRQQGTGMKRIANDTIDNGKFKFIIHTLNNQTEALRIVSKGEGFPNTWLDVYASPGETVSIIGSDKLLRTWNIVSNIKEQQEENQYTNVGFRNLTDQRQRLQALSSDMWKKIAILDSPKEKIQMTDSIQNILYPQLDSLELLLSKEEINLMKNLPVTSIWLDHLEALSRQSVYLKGLPISEAQVLYQQLTSTQRNSQIGKKIEACLTPTKAKIGDDMPDTELSNIDGNHHRLSDYKGKYLLLDFWSRSCGHCIESLPEMEILSDMWKEKVTFIGINIDDEKSWKEFSQRKNIKWIDLNDPKGAFGLYIRYKANGTPFYVLVTPDGKITDIWYGYNKDSLSERLKQGTRNKIRYVTVYRDKNRPHVKKQENKHRFSCFSAFYYRILLSLQP